MSEKDDMVARREAPTTPQKRNGVVRARSLQVRKEHNANADVVAGLKAGDKVTILETWIDGKNIWVRIGDSQWAAMVYNGETYIE